MEFARYNKNNFSENCVWKEIFNDEERSLLQDGFLLTGSMSVICNAWLTVTLLFTSLQFDRSYRNLANFTAVACIRRAVPLMLHLSFLKSLETFYGFHTYSCELYGFLETFLAVFEVECLTHVCIERYVLAKYVTNGWQMKQSHYSLYICLCLFFACLYSVPPLFGVGHYGYDFQCTSCTFDVILPNTWQKYIIVAIFILRSIKPTVVMALMLLWASVLERKFPSTMKHHLHFTWSVTVITVVNLLCWAPIALIRMRVIIVQLIFEDLLPMTTAFYVTWAMWIHWVLRVSIGYSPLTIRCFGAHLLVCPLLQWYYLTGFYALGEVYVESGLQLLVAPVLTTIALFLVDDRVRYKLFNLNAPEITLVETIDIKKD